MKHHLLYTVSISAAALLASCTQPATEQQTVQQATVPEIHNVILMIGDGMGTTQIYSGLTANRGSLNLEQFKVAGFSKTYSFSDYITDSAAGGTALSSGYKTYNGAIGVNSDTVPQPTILEIAEQHGLATGLVSACAVTHATPASFIAHQPSRSMYEAIAADFLKTDIDVFIGGGYDHFTKRADNLNLVDSLKAHGYKVLTSLDQLAAAQGPKIAGLLYPEHPPKMLEGRGDMLAQSAMKAIEVLSKNPKGFFMMIEGSQIDWGGHDNNLDYVSSEMVDFDNTIGRVLEWAKADGHTLVIVTADHETGGLTIGETTTHPFNWEYVNYQKMSKESLSKLFQKMRETGEIDTWEKTKKILAENTGLWDKIPVNAGEEAQLMQCYYETIVKKSSKQEITLYAKSEPLVADAIALLNKKIGVGWTSFSHTGGFVPFYAIGCQARQFGALNDNIEIPNTIRKIMKIK